MNSNSIVAPPSTETLNDEELKNLFEEDFTFPCECSHSVDKSDVLCGLNLHAEADWGSRENGSPCDRSAFGVYTFRGTCGCGKPVVERPYYLCEGCAGTWRAVFLTISFQKI